MKLRDKVWVWNSWASKDRQIEQGEIVGYTDGEEGVKVRLPGRERPYNFLAFECFPTREALCEHYRKIFER